MTRSASLPASIEPFSALLAIHPGTVDRDRLEGLERRDRARRRRSIRPDRETRLTAVWIVKIWSSGATLKSVWLAGRRPSARADFIGLMKSAWARPRLATCVSPK